MVQYSRMKGLTGLLGAAALAGTIYGTANNVRAADAQAMPTVTSSTYQENKLYLDAAKSPDLVKLHQIGEQTYKTVDKLLAQVDRLDDANVQSKQIKAYLDAAKGEPSKSIDYLTQAAELSATRANTVKGISIMFPNDVFVGYLMTEDGPVKLFERAGRKDLAREYAQKVIAQLKDWNQNFDSYTAGTTDKDMRRALRDVKHDLPAKIAELQRL